MAENKSLTDSADAYFQELLSEAQDDNKKPPFEQRVALGSAFTRYLAVRNKLDPPAEEESQVDRFAQQLNGRLRRRGTNTPARREGSGTGDPATTFTERPN